MKRILFISMAVMMATGCSAGEPKSDTATETTEVVQLLQSDSIPTRNILFANIPYRFMSEEERISTLIDENWYELDRTGDADIFVLNPAAWTIEHQAEEPCSGLPTERLIGGFGENTQFFLNLPGLFIGSVWDYPISNGVLRAGDGIVFGPDDVYKLEASGTDFSDINQGQTGSFCLDFFENGKLVQRLIEQSEYNDTKTEVLRILDLNDDDQPDFILSSPHHYEEHRVIIWLSGDQEYTKYEETLGFDC